MVGNIVVVTRLAAKASRGKVVYKHNGDVEDYSSNFLKPCSTFIKTGAS